MFIIPVIDLINGQVVHAQLGHRKHYKVIESLLCKSNNPIEVVKSLLELYPFKRIYIADLDSITKKGDNLAVIYEISNLNPNLEIWLDSGIKKINDLDKWKLMNITHVIGTENIESTEEIANLNQELNENFVLSLDFNQFGFLGSSNLLTNTRYWPRKIIVMSMNLVGSKEGCDLNLLKTVINNGGDREIYAAGGVKNNNDITMLQALKLSGALVATALHNKQLNVLNIVQANL